MSCQDCYIELNALNSGAQNRCIQCYRWYERTTYHRRQIAKIEDLIKIRRKNVARNKARAENQKEIEKIETLKENWQDAEQG